MKIIDCKYFLVPTYKSKALINKGYCQKTSKKCVLLKGPNLSCLKQVKRDIAA